MSEFGSQINYPQLLQRHGRIRIPMIQRDYAQGRTTAKEVRDGFLDALEAALKRSPESSSPPLNLDFIYGTVEGESNTRFSPLDGQQRLTTLFLLHWFLAWQDDCWDQFEALFCGNDGHARFSYSVRESSNEFFDRLVVFKPAARPEDTVHLSALLADQSWYFRHWRLDPTIQSTLTMLDAIHKRFAGSSGLFARLISNEQPAITFQLLDLKAFELSDDLYIKMNARGKPLTPFETFKARYEQFLTKQFAGKTRRIGDRELTTAEFVSLRMDTTWADFFWDHRATSSTPGDGTASLYDEAIMNLFRVLALVTRDPESEKYLSHVQLLRDQMPPVSYPTFYSEGWLDEEFTETLIALLERWSAARTAGGSLQPLLPDSRYFNEAAVFQKLTRDAASLTLTEVTQFAGYVLFIKKHAQALSIDALQDWMRVLRNLAVNSLIEDAEELRRSARGLRDLLPHADVILSYLASRTAGQDNRPRGFSAQQFGEEQVKAGLIRKQSDWRPLIDGAEQHGYFRGQISFLLVFSGAAEEYAKNHNFEWDEPTDRGLQQSFEAYFRKAEAMFTASGLYNLGEFRWQRALLAVGDYLLPMGWGANVSFLVDGATDPASWKRLLRGGSSQGAEAQKRDLLQKLWDRLTEDRPFGEQLDEIIEGAADLPAWREALVRTPKALEYCGNRALRYISDTHVYLLSKKQMNGQHAELFTFCLYDLLSTPEMNKQIAPLFVQDYGYRTDTYDDPNLPLRFQIGKATLEFLIYFTEGQFNIWIDPAAALSRLPDVCTMLSEQAGFAEEAAPGTWLVRYISREEIEAFLTDLARQLASVSATPAKS